MNKLYRLSKKIHQLTGWQAMYIYLGLHILLWGIGALVAGTIGCYLYAHTLLGYRTYIIIAASGIASVIGFLGGVLFLYRQDD